MLTTHSMVDEIMHKRKAIKSFEDTQYLKRAKCPFDLIVTKLHKWIIEVVNDKIRLKLTKPYSSRNAKIQTIIIGISHSLPSPTKRLVKNVTR